MLRAAEPPAVGAAAGLEPTACEGTDREGTDRGGADEPGLMDLTYSP